MSGAIGMPTHLQSCCSGRHGRLLCGGQRPHTGWPQGTSGLQSLELSMNKRYYQLITGRIVCRSAENGAEGEFKERRGVLRQIGLSAGALMMTIGGDLGDLPLNIQLKNMRAAHADGLPLAEGDGVEFKLLEEPMLAYRFEYPTATRSGKPLPLVVSRKPEKYSSAAPLTADARQRIVCELVNLVEAVTISVSVGPPAGLLKSKKPEEWSAKELAEQILIDRSTARVTSGQRVSLSTVENAKYIERGSQRYCVYEHVSQGSPTLLSSSKETYRHALSVTGIRPGLDDEIFLYTLNASCPQDKWADLETEFQRMIESFTLLQPGREYVPPNQDPWRFF
eukprot:jgi/Picsp_1/5235/NSC_02598-R1_lumen targeted protein